MSTATPRGGRTRSSRIAILEDEPDILEVVSYNLERDGYQVLSCENGEEGLALIQREHPDLVLLDLMLPGLDGLEICRRLRGDTETAAIPVIMVTAKGEESDIVLGLGIGADDYVSKPFSPKELLARVRSVLRRSRQQHSDGKKDRPERISRTGLVVDASRHEVLVDGQQQVFTATEFRLLYFLAAHPGRVYTRDQLIHHAIGDEAIIIDRNIDVHIRSVRKKLGSRRDMVETVRGVGYRFADDEQ